jgi:acyl-CoA thioesterase-2
MALDDLGHDTYRSRPPGGGTGDDAGPDRLFGGHVAALALRAAALTAAAGRHPHSVHCSFLGQGGRDEPVELAVHRVRDGRSFTNRQVVVSQHDRHILTLVASFHSDEAGADVQAPVATDCPDPDDVPRDDVASDWGSPVWGSQFDLRVLPIPEALTPLAPAIRFWVRPRTALPEDRVTAACALVYVSDMHSARAAAVITGEQEIQAPLTSLDHAIWLHRPAGPNGWFLVDVRPLSTASSRGLVLGTVHTRAGLHVASFAQEVLVRRPRS